MRLGMVTYQMGHDLDVDGLIALCQAAGLEGVELRTTHRHGVEVSLTPRERGDVRRRFEDAGVAIAGLGSAFEFHATDPQEVRRNIEAAKAYAQLAADVGAPGIKVRPNGLPEGTAPERTYEQIGRAWAEVAAAGADVGVEVRMEVHGARTQEPRHFLQILAHADHPNAKACWNSNATDMDETGDIGPFFEATADRIGLVHITEIGRPQYPWADLFGRLRRMGYAGFCLAEIAHNPEPERFMRYYRTLYDLYLQVTQGA